MNTNRLSIQKIFNNIVIRQTPGSRFFVSAQDSFMVTIPKLAVILKFLIMNDLLSPKVLEGVLEEYYMFTEEE